MSRLSSDKAPEQKLQQDTANSMEREYAPKPSNLAQDLLALQRMAGNQAVTHVLQRAQHNTSPGAPMSEVPMLPEHSPYRSSTLQIRHHLRSSSLPSATIQRKEPHEEEMLQEGNVPSIQRQENHTGLPDHLKAGVEQLSGLSMDDVQVHYNSSKPVEVQALAYTQGTEIHVGPGQERHLPHEAWHVVQQKQGRVRPMMHTGGVMVNDDIGLEQEASAMGEQAFRMKQAEGNVTKRTNNTAPANNEVQSGMHPLLAPQAPLVRTAVGAGAAPAVVHPPLQRIASDAKEWIAYRTSRNKLIETRDMMEKNKAANNQGVRDAIEPHIAQALMDYAADADHRFLRTAPEIAPRNLILDNLNHYANHYTPANPLQLVNLDTYRKHNPSVQLLWKNWQNNWDNPQGKAKFDELYNAIPTIAWNAKLGGKAVVPGTTKNPTKSKYSLDTMQQAVLDGIKHNTGGMKARFDRGVHATNPTTGTPLAKGPQGKEYNAKGNIDPLGMPPIVANWHKNVKQYQDPFAPLDFGLLRFLCFKDKWFYSPTHYLIAGVATPLAYQLIIDA